MPGERRTWRSDTGASLCRCHDVNGRIDSHCQVEALAGPRGEYVARIHEPSSCSNEPPAWRGDADVEASELIVEFRVAEILVEVPAAEIVVHRDLRVPLSNLKELVPKASHPLATARGVHVGNFEMPRRLD